MHNIKVNLSIILPGSTMLSVEETTRVTKSGNRVLDTKKCNKLEVIANKQSVTVFTRKCKPAKQVIHLNEEAYEYMTSAKEVPSKYKGVWRGLSENERLRWHCNQIAQDMGGVVDDIQVLD